MKLEFKQDFIDSNLFTELCFSEYLNLFSINIPTLPFKILDGLNAENANSHFNELNRLTEIAKKRPLELNSIINISKLLPNLDDILVSWKSRSVDQYQIFHLGQYISESLKLITEESHFTKTQIDRHILTRILKILREYTVGDFAKLTLSRSEEKIKNELNEQNKTIEKLLSEYEQAIFKETSLSMTYPFPKELNLNDHRLKKIEKSSLVNHFLEHNFFKVVYVLPPKIEKALEKKNSIQVEFETLMRKKTDLLNDTLFQFYEAFRSIYLSRKELTYNYLLLFIAANNELIFPKLTEEIGLSVKEAKLPCLNCTGTGHPHVPLNIELQKGSNLLYGPNMSGKTTTLKTLYFHLILISVGLPVPAKSFICNFPGNISIHIKNSGNLKQHLSSFGEELAFFAKKQSENSFVFVDEMFNSTNPISAVLLSKIFLDKFGREKVIFFCTSQYPELFKNHLYNLYKMDDIFSKNSFDNIESKLDEIKADSIIDLTKKMPYTITKIINFDGQESNLENNKAIYMALHFPFEDEIKTQLKNIIKDIKITT